MSAETNKEQFARGRELFRIAGRTFKNLEERDPDTQFGQVFDSVRTIGQDATIFNFVGILVERQVREERSKETGVNGSYALPSKGIENGNGFFVELEPTSGKR